MIKPVQRDLPIFFNEELHKYTDAYDREYISTTTIIGKFVEEKDWKGIAQSCANIGSRPVPPTHRNYAKYIRYRGKTVKQILAEWKIITENACEKGTIKHNFLESCVKRCNNYVLNAKGFIDGQIYTIDDIVKEHNYGKLDLDYFKRVGIYEKYPTIYSFIAEMVELGFSIYAEIGVYHPEWLISGLVDILFVKDKDFFILDWKTNKAPIRFEGGYWGKKADGTIDLNNYIITNAKFLHPISHLEDSTGNHYSLQLSMYAYLIEQWGLNYLGTMLCHIRTIENPLIPDDMPHEEVVEFVPISYMKAEVKAIVDWRIKELAKTKQANTNLFNINI